MPLGLFKQRLCAPQSFSGVTSALTHDVQVRCGEKTRNSEGKRQQIREKAADF